MGEKESMQNTIKTLQARTENIQKILQKGNKCTVIHLGSHSIKVGFANDRVPHRVRTLIAYKNKKPVASMQVEMNYHEEEFVQQFQKYENELKQRGIIGIAHKLTKGKPKAKMQLKMKLPDKPYYLSTPLFDQQAMWVAENPEYIVRRPIKHGMLNIQNQSADVMIQDIINIINYSMRQKLKIKTDLKSYSAILILPDIFCRPHIKALIKQLFLQIGFKFMYIHMESVMASFSSTVSSSCIVDIGYQKINVACVEEGVILPGTLIKKNFGGKHINTILKKCIQMKNLISLNKGNVQINLENEGDMFQIENLKEKACFLEDMEDFNHRIYQLFFIRKGKEQVILLPHNDMFCMASHALFCGIWNHLQRPLYAPHFDYNSKLFQVYSDPEDPFQQFSGGGETIPTATDHPHYNVDMSEPYIYNTLEDIIAYSIANVKDADMRKRMMSNILLVGGTAHLPRLSEILQPNLIQKIKTYDSAAQKVEFIDLSLRDIQPIFASWTGGTVIPKLDALKELWIERGKYLGNIEQQVELEEDDAPFQKKFFNKKESSQQWGISYMKQKLPFQW